jgi:hypothetical protein
LTLRTKAWIYSSAVTKADQLIDADYLFVGAIANAMLAAVLSHGAE